MKPLAPARSVALAVTLALAGGCQALNQYATLRRVAAHEREFESLQITRYAVEVELDPAQHLARVHARVDFRNDGESSFARVQVLLADDLELDGVSCAGQRLRARIEPVALGDYRATLIDVDGFKPLAGGDQGTFEFDYSVRVTDVGIDARLDAHHGYLLVESLWVPTLRTPLSETGMERAPFELEIELPVPLVPLGLPDFEVVAEAAGTRTFRGATTVPFAPFFVYGEYAAHLDDSAAAVHALRQTPLEPRAQGFLAAAASELRARYEAAFGTLELPSTRVIVVERHGSSWGAPACVLIDSGILPHEEWREPSTYGLLAHELAHSWWGTSVAMHGHAGYLHEGLANWCAYDAGGARYGADAARTEWEAATIRYASDPEPLGIELDELSIIDGETYKRGAYVVGALFYRALELELGRERFVELLHRFATGHARRSADLADLRRLALDAHPELAPFFERWLDSTRGSDALHRAGREMREQRTAWWIELEPAPDAALRERVATALAQACRVVEELDPSTRAERLHAALAPLNQLPELQITVIDRDCNLVDHATGLTGSVRGHLDLRGNSVYGSIADSKAQAGAFANFDYRTPDLRIARENAIAWRRLAAPDWFVVAEGHGWRTME